MELNPKTEQLSFMEAPVWLEELLCHVLISRELSTLTGKASVASADVSVRSKSGRFIFNSSDSLLHASVQLLA